MRRAALVAFVVLAAAAPAGAAPRSVDFELAAPRTTAEVRAPKRFDLVGLRWAPARRAPHVSIRVRRDGRAFSRWQELAVHDRSSDPLWTGGADIVQYRLSRPVNGLRLHFVRTARFRPRAKPLHAADTRPEVIPRSGWGAGQCPPREQPLVGKAKVALVHHTVTSTAYEPDDVPAMILSICRYHRNSNGWNDIAYNFLVDRFGRIWEGRKGGVDKAVMGAHALGFNAQSTGISNLGTFTYTAQTDVAIEAMARLIRWKLALHGQPTTGTVAVTSSSGQRVRLNRISGHRDANSTRCPGDALYAQLPELRERVGAAEPPPAGPPVTIVVDRPAKYVARRTLLELTGTVDPAKPFVTIVLDKRRDDRWRSHRRIPVSLTDGAFEKSMRLRDPGLYRVFARFDGDGENGRSRSKRYKVRVPHGEMPEQKSAAG